MRSTVIALSLAVFALSTAVFAQTVTAPRQEQPLPDIYAYWPEREAEVRLRRLIRNALLEAHVNYHFESGDVSAFLRYKYYASNYTYRISVFDALTFPDTGNQSTIDYERVRGAALLLTFPRNYSNRYLFLLEGERLTFGDVSDPESNPSEVNVFTKVAYQFGTQSDERLNAVAGEARASVRPLLTGFRGVSADKGGFSVALAQTLTSAYRYTRFETEVLRRFEPTQRMLVFARLHLGTFATYQEEKGVPRQELFRLGGRDALISLPQNNQFTEGLHEIHTRGEVFVPILRNRDLRTGPFQWNEVYAAGYLGAGSVGNERDNLLKGSEVVVDAGVGFETGVTLLNFDGFVTVMYAHTLSAPCVRDPVTGSRMPGERCLEGGTWTVSVRTVR